MQNVHVLTVDIPIHTMHKKMVNVLRIAKINVRVKYVWIIPRSKKMAGLFIIVAIVGVLLIIASIDEKRPRI